MSSEISGRASLRDLPEVSSADVSKRLAAMALQLRLRGGPSEVRTPQDEAENASFREDLLCASEAVDWMIREAAADKAKIRDLTEKLEDAHSTLDAWFDTRKLLVAEVGPEMKRAAAGWLKVSMSGGMPKRERDLTLASIEVMIEDGTLVEPAVRFARTGAREIARRDLVEEMKVLLQASPDLTTAELLARMEGGEMPKEPETACAPSPEA